MKNMKSFEEFVNEGTTNKCKYVFWKLSSLDNKKVDTCSITFHNELKYHTAIPYSMEQHHPKLFKSEGGYFKRTQLALDLGVIPPSDSYSLSCGLPNKIGDFLKFWEDEGYVIVYDEPTSQEELFNKYIKDNKLAKFTKEKI